LAACITSAADALAPLSLADSEPSRVIVVGGTGEYLARLVSSTGEIAADQIEAALARCQQQPSDDLAAALGISPARARVLPAGIAIVRVLEALIRPDRITVAGSGIRTGLLLETFAALPCLCTNP
jgi:exopolyphosphatase/pppGpp-phosphohydrolase